MTNIWLFQYSFIFSNLNNFYIFFLSLSLSLSLAVCVSLAAVVHMNSVKPATCVSELAEFYRESCKRHNAHPIESIMKHLDTLDLNSNSRRPVLNLREQNLTAESCEALEEVLKRVSHMHLYMRSYLSGDRNSCENK